MKRGNRNHPLGAVIEHPEPPRYQAQMPEDAPVLRWHVTDDALDRIAAMVRRLPEQCTVAQKERLSIIARELLRRSK